MPHIKAGLIGMPLNKSLSPALFQIFAKLAGREIEYSLWEYGEDGFPEAIVKARAEDWNGFNATIPDKEALAGLAEKLDRAAAISGSANCARLTPEGLEARNTDAAGLAAALLDRGMDFTGKKAVVFGSGGSASTTAFVLAEAGAAEILFAARNPGGAGPAIERLKASFPNTLISAGPFTSADGAHIVVNATPLGMYGEGSLPVTPVKGQVCVDWPYLAGGTIFTRQARAAGAIMIDGLELLVRQGVLDLLFWDGCRESDITEFNREALALLKQKAGG